MNKYIPSEKNDNKPCQNKECPMHNTENEYPDNCDLMNHTRWMHNCKGYQPEQEEKSCQTCVNEKHARSRYMCADCINFDQWQPKEEKPASAEWERIPFLSKRPIVIDDDLGRMQEAVNNNCDGVDICYNWLKVLDKHLYQMVIKTEADIKRLKDQNLHVLGLIMSVQLRQSDIMDNYELLKDRIEQLEDNK